MKGDTSGLGFNTFEQGKSSKKIILHLKTNRYLKAYNQVRRSLNQFVLTTTNLDILLMFVGADLVRTQAIILILDMCLEYLKVIVTHAICMDIDQLNADMEQITQHLI